MPREKLHAGMWLPGNEVHLLDQIDKYPLVDGKGTYQLHKLEKALTYVKGPRKAIDIGAHVGLWSRILIKHFFEVIAFEPHPHHVELFCKNLGETENVFLYSMALGHKKGVVNLVYDPENSGHTHIGEHGLQVPIDTLDSFNLDEIDLIKIDVEGFEHNVLLGAKQTILENKPIVICENKGFDEALHGGEKGKSIELMKSWGMVLLEKISGDFIMGWESNENDSR
jgi:FkbM family methyltransferase